LKTMKFMITPFQELLLKTVGMPKLLIIEFSIIKLMEFLLQTRAHAVLKRTIFIIIQIMVLRWKMAEGVLEPLIQYP